MDDFNVSSLTESRNEYSAMLVTRLTPQIITGVNSIFNEAVELCQQNDEEEKYLMTFQNFLARVPKWNQDIVDIEKERIIKATNCTYLEDLLTCVHITQLKILTNMRVGNKQKKIELDIPNLSSFIHKVYIAVSRKVYKNVFLYEQNILPLDKQKNMRELEQIVEGCILNTVRESMPIESILRSYLDESLEENIEQIKEKVEEVIEPIKPEEVKPEIKASSEDSTSENNVEKNDDGDKPSETENKPNISIDTESSEKSDSTPTASVTKIDTSGSSDSSLAIIKKVDDIVKPTVIEPSASTPKQSLNFSDSDNVLNYDKTGIPGELSQTKTEVVTAPKTIERLEEISEKRWEERRMEDDEEDEDDAPLKIMSDIKLDSLDIQNMNNNPIKLDNKDLLGDIVQL